jgi:4'-phosphopantetheinyl transferase superfamily
LRASGGRRSGRPGLVRGFARSRTLTAASGADMISGMSQLLAISDLHVAYKEKRLRGAGAAGRPDGLGSWSPVTSTNSAKTSNGRSACCGNGSRRWRGRPASTCPRGVLEAISLPPERAMIARLAAAVPGTCWDRLLFSAKESVYKAWFPLTRLWLEFSEAEVVIDPVAGTFVGGCSCPG